MSDCVQTPLGVNLSSGSRLGGQRRLQEGGASASTAGDLLRHAALLSDCVGGSPPEHREAAVRPGQHLHGARSEGPRH